MYKNRKTNPRQPYATRRTNESANFTESKNCYTKFMFRSEKLKAINKKPGNNINRQ